MDGFLIQDIRLLSIDGEHLLLFLQALDVCILPTSRYAGSLAACEAATVCSPLLFDSLGLTQDREFLL